MEFGIINQFFCFENSAIMMSGELHFYRVVASYQSNLTEEGGEMLWKIFY